MKIGDKNLFNASPKGKKYLRSFTWYILDNEQHKNVVLACSCGCECQQQQRPNEKQFKPNCEKNVAEKITKRKINLEKPLSLLHIWRILNERRRHTHSYQKEWMEGRRRRRRRDVKHVISFIKCWWLIRSPAAHAQQHFNNVLSVCGNCVHSWLSLPISATSPSITLTTLGGCDGFSIKWRMVFSRCNFVK